MDKRIVITRARSQAGELARRIGDLGGETIDCPTIEIQPPESYDRLDAAIGAIHTYDWLIFTSVNGVERFLMRLKCMTGALGKLTGSQIAAIGPQTAARLARAGLNPAVVPKQYMAEGILHVLASDTMVGKRVLIPRADKARDVLPETLRERGATVDVVEVYRTVVPNTDVSVLRTLLREQKIDMVTFTSSSTVVNFAKLFRVQSLAELLAATAIACIGPITKNTVEGLGGHAAVVADQFTIAGLVRAIAKYFQGQARM
ncbi:MAG TPA: uroporphyrinogen-III synthase [Candidatus Binatia bacterium]|nr:uroporphyrinogen-III synthase [Candidatus Binatia bacterium]